MYDYLIVGAGLYGAAFANIATRAGKSCLVIDKRSHVAGNAYTEKFDDYYVHKYGPHIFHTKDERIWNYVTSFVSFNRFTNMPIAQSGGEIYNLPFNMNTFAKLFGVTSPAEAKKAIDEDAHPYITRMANDNLEDFVLSTVGPRIYKTLIKGYTEKQWGRPCSELPPDIISRIPLRYTYDNSYFNDPFQGIPACGYTELVNAMLDGCHVRLNTDYFADFYAISGGKDKIAEKTVYTGPIDKFFDYRYGVLEYRSLHFAESVEDCANVQGVAVKNYIDPDIPWTRRIEHKHFTGSSSSTSFLTYEIPTEWGVGKEPFYPIEDEKNLKLYAKYRRLAAKIPDVIIGGRLGRYQYLNMDKTIYFAMHDAAKDLGIRLTDKFLSQGRW